MTKGLWKNRNDMVQQHEREEASNLDWLTLHKWQEWFSAKQNYDIEVNHTHLLHWISPPSDWLKCNVNASFSCHLGITNRGWCLRDNFGGFVTAGAAWDDSTLTIIEVWALTLKGGYPGSYLFAPTCCV